MTTLFISHSSKDREWAKRVHKALSDSDYQCLFLDSYPDDGIHAGADWEQTLYQRLRQSRGVVVLCSANWLASPWCVAEAIMARERKRCVFLLATADVIDSRQVKGLDRAAPQIPDFLKDKQFISLAGVIEEKAHQLLLRGLEKEGLKKRDFKLPERPYPGLEPFQETDAAVFFGRDDESDRVINLLHQRRKGNAKGFVLVLGASGCGKSSLVRAGVLPQLKHASKDDARSWVVVRPFLGGKGLGGLALSFAQAFKDAGQPREFGAVRGRVAAPSDLLALGNELLIAHSAPEGCVLLVLDQLEEVFGAPEESEARTALRLVLDASADGSGSVVVLATMRSDFLNAFQLFEGAAKRYEEVTLDPMLRPHFSEVIEGPANRFGLDLDAGLSGRMVQDTAYNDALPLLAFTLEKLYEKCKPQGQLTLKAYDELGGVSAAIEHSADQILSETGCAGRPADDPRIRDLRRAFYSLAQVGEEGQFTRRTALRSQMPPSCEAVLKRFVEQRLLVSDTENGEPVLGVAHEALFRVWDTLRGWLRQDRKALALRSHIEDAATEWQAENRTASRAWPEERVLDAVHVIDASGVSLADVKDRATVDAFLGPTDPKQLETLLALGAAEDTTAGSGRYGDAWRLPLGHEARASAGVRLALLGDTRRGVGPRADGLPDIDWCRVGDSEVTIEIRSNPDDRHSPIVKRLTRAVDHFWMARYPVTVAQFQAFLGDCHREGAWRLPPGFPAALPADYQQPKHWARHGNHPADSVNWYDAAAFCHWLSVRFGFEVRLPTEFQCQLAANGGDATRTYPWGPDWDPGQEPWRANTLESGLGRSTAVGMYPAGASPAGILDMAGTLWEWCQNAFDDPDNDEFPTPQDRQNRQDRRVLRGGSWSHARGYACSAYRYGPHRTTGSTTSAFGWCVHPRLPRGRDQLLDASIRRWINHGATPIVSSWGLRRHILEETLTPPNTPRAGRGAVGSAPKKYRGGAARRFQCSVP